MFPTTMQGEWSVAPRDRVGGAIARASARTGVDFTYLFQQAKIESGLNPAAKAKTSTATGLYQFIDQTWLGTVKKHGAAHGLGWAAEAIQRGSDGRFRVADPSVRQSILDLRKQPEAASAMAAEFASDNRDHLERRIGRAAQPVDLYLAHFLGAGGAGRFLAAHDANPDAPAASLLPAAARANKWVFYNRDGSARSFAEIRERFAAKLGDDAPAAPRLPKPIHDGPQVRLAALETGAAAPEPFARPSPEYARLAYLMLAQLGA